MKKKTVQREALIDKTDRIREALKSHPAVVLCSMPGTGKKTAVRMLLQQEPEVHGVLCDPGEAEDGSVLKRRRPGQVNWYLVRRTGTGDVLSRDGIFRLIRQMPREDRLLFSADGMVPADLLELVWNGMLGVVLPDTFWFSEGETFRYLKAWGSRLKSREVYALTGGWAGCIAMLVQLSRQLPGSPAAGDLIRRYEVGQFIRREILPVLTKEERAMLEALAPFPRIRGKLAPVLFPGWSEEVQEQLLVRGAARYLPWQRDWQIHPALRAGVRGTPSEDLLIQAAGWYEKANCLQEALKCLEQLSDEGAYRDCVLRHYTRLPFLDYRKVWEESVPRVPAFFYLEWMDRWIRQDEAGMEELRQKADVLPPELFLNVAYGDPLLSTERWMELLEERTDPDCPVRLYDGLGESVSFLGGVRDLSDLFAGGEEQEERYRKLWRQRLTADCQRIYDLARQEYRIQTESLPREDIPGQLYLQPYDRSTPWQERLVLLYLAFLQTPDGPAGPVFDQYSRELARSLLQESSRICRWNAGALYLLLEARRGDRERLIRWVRETGGDLRNETGRTRFYMAAEVRVYLYLGDPARARELLQVLLTYLSKNRSFRWLAEGLFQLALITREEGETGKALRLLEQSLAVSRPRGYTRMYLSYGARGAGLLKEYWDLAVYQKEAARRTWSEPEMEMLKELVREADRRKRGGPDPDPEERKRYQADQLTQTERLVLGCLAEGLSNSQISQQMHIRLSTVKSHTYHIYRKLGASNRVQAVKKAREYGIL